MATTLVACALRYDRAVVAHVGDSRCYLIRAEGKPPCSRAITPSPTSMCGWGCSPQRKCAEADTRHVLSRSLGSELFVNVEINDHQVFPGDVLLLCSDGLHGALTPSDMATVVGETPDLDQGGAETGGACQ